MSTFDDVNQATRSQDKKTFLVLVDHIMKRDVLVFIF